MGEGIERFSFVKTPCIIFFFKTLYEDMIMYWFILLLSGSGAIVLSWKTVNHIDWMNDCVFNKSQVWNFIVY